MNTHSNFDRLPDFSELPTRAIRRFMLATGFLSSAILTAPGIQASPSQPNPAQRALLAQSFGQRPLSFEANLGQTDPTVRFLSRGQGYSLFLTPTEAVLTLRKSDPQSKPRHNPSLPGKIKPPTAAVLRMQLQGANPTATVEGLNQLPGKTNYFRGKDPKAWRTGIPSYAKVKYNGVYPGIDLVYYGNQKQLEYDFVVAPGADPNVIRLNFEGAEKLTLDAEGRLIVQAQGGNVVQHKPVIYQEIGGMRKEIDGSYVLYPNKEEKTPRIGFQLAHYDASKPLTIDPVLGYSTYLGGGSSTEHDGFDIGSGIAVDNSGNAYVTGFTNSGSFPVVNTGSFGNIFYYYGDAFVTKFDPKGAVIYSTVFGGSLSDVAIGIAADAQGNAYVTGATYYDDFPTLNSISATCQANNAFVTKFNPDGTSLIYSTCFGGVNATGGAIALDRFGNAYVTGVAGSSFTATNSAQPTFGGGQNDAFVAKLNAGGNALIYATYLGGNGDDSGSGIALDRLGNAYVTGSTQSDDNFPIVRAFQPTFVGENPYYSNAFVAKLNAAGNAFVFSTYLGGSHFDHGTGIAVDRFGNAYVAGSTASSDFPSLQSINETCGAQDYVYDAFITKFSPRGAAVYSTCFGGSGSDYAEGIALDRYGNPYVTGNTGSTDFPSQRSLQACDFDAFVTKLNSAGTSIVYSTCLGGNLGDVGNGIAVDRFGNAYLTGETYSIDFPTVQAFQPTPPGGDYAGYTSDAFVTKIVGN